MLHPGQAARILLVDPITFNRLIAAGELHVARKSVSGQRLFDYDEVRALRRRRDTQARRTGKRKAASHA